MAQITSPGNGSKNEFLPSDIWAKNVVELEPESKRQGESYVSLITFTVLALAFVAGAFQWIVPSVQDADKLLMDQISALEQRNLLLEAQLRRTSQVHTRHIHSRRLMQSSEPSDEFGYLKELEALNLQTSDLLADSDWKVEVPVRPTETSVLSKGNWSVAALWNKTGMVGVPTRVFSTGISVAHGVRELGYSASRQLMGYVTAQHAQRKHAPTAAAMRHRDPRTYRQHRASRSGAWRKKRVKKGRKQRKQRNRARRMAKIRRHR